MKTVTSSLLGTLFVLNAIQTAHASETYTYYSGNFDSFQTVNSSTSQIFNSSTNFNFSFTVDTALTANSTLSIATAYTSVPQISSWLFTDNQGHTVNNLQDATFQSFSITTDSNGLINSWNISLLPVNTANNYVFADLFYPNVAGCIGNAGVVGNCTGNMHVQEQVGFSDWSFGGSSAIGNWQATQTAVPLPGALVLFLSCISGWKLLSSRSKNQLDQPHLI